jgi:hypothetical protein
VASRSNHEELPFRAGATMRMNCDRPLTFAARGSNIRFVSTLAHQPPGP